MRINRAQRVKSAIHVSSVVAGLVLLAAQSPVQAALITSGFTYSVASACGGGVGSVSTGDHFHSNTGGSFGNPAGLAEVGEFSGSDCEEVRGLSEYNLAGLSSGSAFVTFEVYQAGGLFPGSNDFPFDGTIEVKAYEGNNVEDISDFQALSLGTVGDFATSSLVVGNTLSFDISSIFNSAIADGFSSLGMRLEAVTDPNGGAWVFNDFRLTSTDDSTSVSVPEPATLGLLGLGLAVIGFKRCKR